MTAFRSACLKRFSPYATECGEDLVSSSSVTLLDRGPTSFVAQIDGESVAIVSRPGSTTMFALCTCKLFALGLDGCRHLWALVATIDDAGLVGASVLTRDFDLVPLRPPSASFWIEARRPASRARDRETSRAGPGLRRMGFVGRWGGVHPPSPHRRRRG